MAADSRSYRFFETGNLAGSVRKLEKASKLVEGSWIPEATKEAARVRLMMTRARILAAVHEFEAARAVAEKCRAKVEARGNAPELRAVEAVFAALELEQGNATRAIEHFSKADARDPYNMFYLAQAKEESGDKVGARELYQKIVGWNENALQYALVRACARAKASRQGRGHTARSWDAD